MIWLAFIGVFLLGAIAGMILGKLLTEREMADDPNDRWRKYDS